MITVGGISEMILHQLVVIRSVKGCARVVRVVLAVAVAAVAA